MPSNETLQKIQTASEIYENRLCEHLQRLGICLMRDLLLFLRQDARSIDEIRIAVSGDEYEKSIRDYQTRGDAYVCTVNFTRRSFDKIMRELKNAETEPQDRSTRYVSAETLKVFREAARFFRQFAQECGTDGVTEEIMRNAVHDWYGSKKAQYFGSAFHDAWYWVAEASGGRWSTKLYGITLPHSTQFCPERTRNFLRSNITKFNACIDRITLTDNEKDLKENLKRQFRDNSFEYLFRGIRNATPFPGRDHLIEAVLRYAESMPDLP